MESIQLSEDDNTKTVVVGVDQLVVLRLPENPTTGYRWEAPDGVAVVHDEYLPPHGSAVGGSGERVFTFASPASPIDVSFALTRPWGGGEPDRVVTLSLRPES
jgi:predicted secreted protein